jgi:hypothetical protein
MYALRVKARSFGYALGVFWVRFQPRS